MRRRRPAGFSGFSTGKTVEEISQKSFEKVIALDNDYNLGYAYYALGRALELQGKTNEAIKNYKLFTKYNNDKEMINTVQDQIKQLQQL